MIFTPPNPVPERIVIIEQYQLHSEANGSEYKATTKVAKDRVGESQANNVAEGLPRNRLGNGSFSAHSDSL
jgi:hypothetical protein